VVWLVILLRLAAFHSRSFLVGVLSVIVFHQAEWHWRGLWRQCIYWYLSALALVGFLPFRGYVFQVYQQNLIVALWLTTSNRIGSIKLIKSLVQCCVRIALAKIFHYIFSKPLKITELKWLVLSALNKTVSHFIWANVCIWYMRSLIDSLSSASDTVMISELY